MTGNTHHNSIIKKVLKYSGCLWVHKNEMEWLNDTFYAINGSRLKESSEFHYNLIRAGILGSIYTELCYQLVDEMGLCQDEGLINGLKICLEECTDLSKESIKYLVQEQIVKNEHKIVIRNLKNFYWFKAEDEWDQKLFNDMVGTFTDYSNEHSNLYVNFDRDKHTRREIIVLEKIGKVFLWMRNGFELSYKPHLG